jgi:REP element-mobilizing transposase RayT
MIHIASRPPQRSTRGSRHFIAVTTHRRERLFTHPFIVSRSLGEFLRVASARNVAVLAYCFMPDEVDLLVECRSTHANLRLFVELAKHCSGHLHKQTSGQTLWQDGYEARTLSPSEDLKQVARHLLEHPVRAGLASDPRRYPYCGSAVWTPAELRART